MLKWKRFEDSEAFIIGFVEAEQNTNAQETNELGLSKRSHAKAGKIKKGTLGAFKVRDAVSRVEFEIGTGKGLTAALRQKIWDNQAIYLGTLVNYTFQPTGIKDKPRFPSFVGFRGDL